MNRSRSSGQRRPQQQQFGGQKKSNTGYKGAAAAVPGGNNRSENDRAKSGSRRGKTDDRRDKRESVDVNKGHGVLIKTWGAVNTSATVSERGMSFADILKAKGEKQASKPATQSISVGNKTPSATHSPATPPPQQVSPEQVELPHHDATPFKWEDDDGQASKSSTPLFAPAEARPIDEAMVAAAVASPVVKTASPAKPVRSISANKKPSTVKGITSTERGRGRDEQPPAERKRSRSGPRNRSPSQQRAQARYEELSDKVVLPFDVKITKKSAFSFSGEGVEEIDAQQEQTKPASKSSAKKERIAERVKEQPPKKTSVKKKGQPVKQPEPTTTITNEAKKPSETKKEKKKKRLAAAKEAAKQEAVAKDGNKQTSQREVKSSATPSENISVQPAPKQSPKKAEVEITEEQKRLKKVCVVLVYLDHVFFFFSQKIASMYARNM